MFRNKRREPPISTLIGKDTVVNGDLEFSGGCLVDGYVKGNVRSKDADEASAISVSERGCIEGAVDVPNVLLNGTVKGDVRARTRIELGSNAVVVGNVQYNLIEMAIGAEVNGKLIHESENLQQQGSQDEPVEPFAPPGDPEPESLLQRATVVTAGKIGDFGT